LNKGSEGSGPVFNEAKDRMTGMKSVLNLAPPITVAASFGESELIQNGLKRHRSLRDSKMTN